MKNLPLERPLAFLDLETTGTRPESDRIVEISVVVLRPGGGEERLTRRVNPGVPIPAAATAVHGITDADVAAEPPFARIAAQVARLLQGADLAGFNVINYDLPLLEAEFARAGATFDREGRRLLDAQRIFHRREPRTLAAAVKFYTGRDHEGAHGAEADVLATVEVLDAQLERYPDLPRDVEGLARACRPDDWVDSQGKVRWAGEAAVLSVGKHGGRTLRDVARDDPSYLEWLAERSDFPADVRAIAREALAGRFPERSSGPPEPAPGETGLLF
jgi:DNA polymerase-3 subunit epsilon